ncbi:venom dipeptidyl peptidase 4-like [Lycorma delicatula]|uniref:venom dipeptidyl peptidase 4-like n=1 Tax=Lycorma delicatula TaxID=130591 RepID=UPI003F51192A
MEQLLLSPLYAVFILSKLCLIGLSLFPLSASSERLLSLEDTVYGTFRPEVFNGTWVSDTEIVYKSKNTGDILILDVSTQRSDILANSSILGQYNASTFSLSADLKWIAIPFDKKQGFRHSFTAKFAVHELKTGFHYEVAGGSRIQLLEWSPVGHALVYVMDNDLYYQHKPGPLAADRITHTGLPGVVYNGIADWVYEEEVFSTTKTLWFSPEGTKLAFATFDDSAVHEVNIIKYGNPGDLASQYVQEIPIRYPKAGSTNPTVLLNVVDLRLKRRLKIVNLQAPVDEVSEEHILVMVKWVDDSHVASTWTPRTQNSAVLLVCEVTAGDCEKALVYKETNGWVDWPEPFFKNLTTLITILPQPQPGVSGNYKHLTLVTPNGEKALTTGRREVTKIIAWDQINSIIYYKATLEDNPGRIHIYSISDDGKGDSKCLSCSSCGTSSAEFSREQSYMVLTCTGPDVPDYSVHTSNGTLVMNLGQNLRLRERMKDLVMPYINDLQVPIEDNLLARVRLLLPPELKNYKETPNENKRYPLLLSVYGGPDSQKIQDRFAVPSWDHYLATRLGIVVAYVDGRGSGHQGDKLKFAVYRKLGGPEIEDFISVAGYLQKNLNFIDKRRTAIWGWSYGGFATAMTLAKDKNVFKCGISVAPVTSWIYYDSIYTERYMGLPTLEDNQIGYNESDVTRNVGNFRNKLFYLIHGNADDNVHYQQSMALSRAFELNDILFYQQSYPDEAHGLAHVTMHLYHSMEKFWSKCLEVKPSSNL